MFINIVFYVSTTVLCNKTYLNVIFFTTFVQQLFIYNKFIETDLHLVDEGCVMSFLGKLTQIDIDKYLNYFIIVYYGDNYTPPYYTNFFCGGEAYRILN